MIVKKMNAGRKKKLRLNDLKRKLKCEQLLRDCLTDITRGKI